MEQRKFTFKNSLPPQEMARGNADSSRRDAEAEKTREKSQSTFDHKGQRLRLLRSGSIRLFTTAFVCAAIAATIYGFSTLDHGMTTGQRRGYNTIVVALSMTLSLILFHSLEWGAQVVRWRILASKYYTPEEFNLIYDCDRKMSNMRLFWVARTRGKYWPNTIQWFVLFYVFLSIALLVDTALVGLTYSVDVSSDYKMSKQGTIMVANMSTISPIRNTTEAQYQQAQNFGLISQGFLPIKSDLNANGPGPAAILSVQYNTSLGVFWYRFSDLSLSNPRNYDISDRYITSNATCREVNIVSGGYGGPTNLTVEAQANASIVRLQDGDAPVQDLYVGELQAPGSITWLSSIDMGSGDCGPRCAHVWALQSAAQDSPGNEDPKFWKCTSTVSRLMHLKDKDADLSHLDMPDKWAQVMAGSIGFSGVTTPGLPYQRVLYADGNAFAPMINVTTPEVMTGTIKWFAAGAFAAMDGFGPRLNITSNDEPIPAQILRVQWRFTAVLLALPPLVQAMVLVAVVSYGNKVKVRDGGALATAELLRPNVDSDSDHQGEVQFEKHALGSLQSDRMRYWPVNAAEAMGTG